MSEKLRLDRKIGFQNKFYTKCINVITDSIGPSSILRSIVPEPTKTQLSLTWDYNVSLKQYLLLINSVFLFFISKISQDFQILISIALKKKFHLELADTVGLFDLILYFPSTIFQLCRDGSPWVEPVLS